MSGLRLRARARTPADVGGGLERPRLGIAFWVAVAFLGLLSVAAVFAGLLPLTDPAETFRGMSNAPPSASHVLGNDGIGRDVLSRVIHGAQTSLLLSTVSTAVALLIGGTLGMTGAYFSGRVDRVMSAALNITLLVPPIILFIALVLFLDATAERRVTILIFTFVLLSIAPIARVTRAATLVWAERDFVLAARTIGAHDSRILTREVLPNVMPSLVSYGLIVMAALIVVEGSVAFLGLSVPPPTPTWGDMINKGRNSLGDAPHVSLVPAAFMFATVLALNFAGDKLSQRYDPREGLL